MLDSLLVNELFGPTYQGEGKSAGQTVAFIRLATCNLACSFCDTPYTWNWRGTAFQHDDKFSKKDEVHEYSTEQAKAELDAFGVRRIVISGGEPLLQQQKLLPLLKALKADGYSVEIETNGTIKPLPELLDLVDQVNCSPKTENSGTDNRTTMRLRPEALKSLSASAKTNFKFVVSCEQDVIEVKSLVEAYDIKDAYLMPRGRTREEQLYYQGYVKELAAKHGFHFTRRLHVLEFDTKRGV